MNIKNLSVSEIKVNPNNPRSIKDGNFKKLVQSIKSAPWMMDIRPIVIDSKNVILGGNMRYQACVSAGLKTVPVIFADKLTEEQKQEFIIKDNVGFGDWDFEMLEKEWNFDKLEEWGLELPDFKRSDECEEDEYEIDEEIQTDIVIGDIIEIGDHRLVCGDSTNPDVVDKVLDGSAPYLMVTDPPYGVEYKPEWRNQIRLSGRAAIGAVKNDDNADWTESWSLSPSKVAYVYHAGKFAGVVQKSLEDCDFEIRSQIIWNKSNFAISRCDYHWKHEPCWYAVKKGAKSEWAAGRNQSTVWDIAKNSKNESGHSTQKPVECMFKAIQNHNGDVYDPFLGSGTTMIAAHQLKRKCYGIELDPKYCQIIINRMMKLDCKLIVKINNKFSGGSVLND